MRGPEGIAALILAAGNSTRMGALKPLLRIGNTAMVELASQCFLKAGVRDVTVIVGCRAELIIPMLQDLRVKWVLNTEYESGMLSSVLTGIRSLASHVRAFFLLPCDIPLVGPETIKALTGVYGQTPAPVIYPVFGGLRGHPPLISMDSVRDLAPECEGGMRSFLRRYEDLALNVEVMDEGILLDCDTPEDYRKLLAHASGTNN